MSAGGNVYSGDVQTLNTAYPISWRVTHSYRFIRCKRSSHRRSLVGSFSALREMADVQVYGVQSLGRA